MKQPSDKDGWKVGLQYSREEIWSNVLKHEISSIDSAGTSFQPEEQGFVLCSITSKL